MEIKENPVIEEIKDPIVEEEKKLGKKYFAVGTVLHLLGIGLYALYFYYILTCLGDLDDKGLAILGLILIGPIYFGAGILGLVGHIFSIIEFKKYKQLDLGNKKKNRYATFASIINIVIMSAAAILLIYITVLVNLNN